MDLVEIGSNPGADPHRTLESGNILFFPGQLSGLSQADREFLLGVHLTGGKLHKNVAYKPGIDRVTGFDSGSPEFGARLHSVMRTYSEWAVRFTGEVLPRYKSGWKLDYASFRPEEEEGRDLPWKKRNDLLHVDAFPSRPTHGDLILRVFTNINPIKPRVWLTSDPFQKLAPLYADQAGLQQIATGSALDGPRRSLTRGLRSLGLPLVDRSPYDSFMLGFHDYLKQNSDYQKNCPKYRFDLPPGSTWMVFTDVVPHAVLSGQFALEQTFIISRATLSAPELAPAAVLEKLARKPLTA